MPLEDDAIYRIYSMTKPVVSVMALILIQRGQLHLSDFVMEFIPAFANTEVLCTGGTEQRQHPMTVEDLLTHRSGEVITTPYSFGSSGKFVGRKQHGSD